MASWATPGACAGYDDLNAGISYLNLRQYDNALVWLGKAIAAGDLIPDHLRVAHLDRGLAYIGKADAQKALDEFTASIAAQPDDPTGYHARIPIYLANGMLEKALADFNTLNGLRPHDYGTLMNIGRLNWYLDRPETSAAAFSVFSYNLRVWLWLQLSHVRMGKPVGSPETISPGAAWPGSAVRFYLGQLSEAEFLKAAAADNDKVAVCEGNFYAAMWRLVHADQLGAKPLLDAAVKTCDGGLNIGIAARRELDKLNRGGKAQ